jgi:hypothetical protein
MRRNILGLAAAVAFCTATMTTGAIARIATAAIGSVVIFRSGFRQDAFSRGFQRFRFAPSLDLWDWGGGWWAGYDYCGGWAYEYGYAPDSCYIYGGW